MSELARTHTQAQHTPGPWRVYEGGNFVRIGAVGYDEYVKKHSYLGGPFCVAEAEHNATGNYEANHELAMANARLIAAAPDAYKLTEHILAMADDAYLAGHPEWNEIVNEAKQIQAKAQGGTRP